MKDSLTLDDIEHLYRRFVVIRRRRYRIDVYERSGASFRRLIYTCRCAIGMPGHETTRGPATIIAKSNHPDWQVPHSQWAIDAGLTPGKVYPADDPANPIRGAFLRFTADGEGIHGTDSLWSLGTKASHGCARVRVEDALWFYNNVSVGTPVFVV